MFFSLWACINALFYDISLFTCTTHLHLDYHVYSIYIIRAVGTACMYQNDLFEISSIGWNFDINCYHT